MRAWYMGRLVREQVLLLVLIGAAAVVWSTNTWDRVQAWGREVRLTSATLETQALWLSRREGIESRAREAVENLDGSRTYNAVRLFAEINALAKQAGIDQALRSESQPTELTAQFSVHTVQLNLNGVAWESLLAFYEALSARAPYISIERFSLVSARNSGGASLDARLTVSSVEIAGR